MKLKNRGRWWVGGAWVVLLALVAGALYASPWWALHQLRQAARDRDVDAVLARVDQPALRQSVRLALGFGLSERTSEQAPGTVLDPMTDTLTSPTLLIAMLLQGRPSRALDRAGAFTLALPEAPGDDWPATLRYLDRSTVEVRPAKAPAAGGFILRRHGVLGWRLSGLVVPG